MPDRLSSLVLLVGFWIPPAVAGWTAAKFAHRRIPHRRTVLMYAVLITFVLAWSAAWFLFQLDRIYSKSDQGVFTHMGSETHIHCALDEPLSSGHVDHVTIPVGTTVKFPTVGTERPNEAMQRTDSAGR